MAGSAEMLARLAALPGVGTASELLAEHPAGAALPVASPLSAVLPGLRKGSTVSVRGSRSLLLALLAEATQQGSWAAVLGMPDLGVVAAAELGVDTRRLALVAEPGRELLRVAAAALDGIDLVVLAGGGPGLGGPGLGSRELGQLATRARHRGAVLLLDGPFPGVERPGVDLELRCVPGPWGGLAGGWGYLRQRAVTVEGVGRGAAARTNRVRLLLPGPEGPAAELDAAGLDAADLDAVDLNAADLDAFGLDAGGPDAGGLDASELDTGGLGAANVDEYRRSGDAVARAVVS